MNGFITAAIYFGSGLLDVKGFIPKEYHNIKYDESCKGKMVGMVVLSPIESPFQNSDVGWYFNLTPKGDQVLCTTFVFQRQLAQSVHTGYQVGTLL